MGYRPDPQNQRTPTTLSRVEPYNFMPADAEARVEAWCATGSDDVGAGWDRGELEEHIRDEHSTFTWLLEPMIERVGFTITEAVYSDDAFFAKYVLTKS